MKLNHENEFNIVCDKQMKNHFDVKTIKKRLHKKIKEKLNIPNDIPPNNIRRAIIYCPIKYHDLLFQKFANILNNKKNNVKIAFKIYKYSIKAVSYEIEKNKNKPFVSFQSYDVYKLTCSL